MWVPFFGSEVLIRVGRDQEEKNMSWTFFQNVSLPERIYGISEAWYPRPTALFLGLIIVALVPPPPDCLQGSRYRIIFTYVLARAGYVLVAIAGSYLVFCPCSGTSFAYRDSELGVKMR